LAVEAGHAEGSVLMSDEEWELVVALYRRLWKAHADLATFRIMLKTSELAASQNRADIAVAAVKGWEARLEKSSQANFYLKYLANCESHIAQAQGDHSAAKLVQLISHDPPKDFPPKMTSN
jgi:hypothetical protein